jgi:DNA-binding protein HU-beta
MTRADLNQEISRKNKINATEVSAITEALFEIIKDEIAQGNKITFKGFGTFKTKKRAAKKVQLIKKKQTVDLAEHYIPTFLPSKFLLNR